MTYIIEKEDVNDREVPATFHQAINQTINAVKEKLIHPEARRSAAITRYTKKRAEVESYSFLGSFLNEDELYRIHFNDQFNLDAGGEITVCQLLGINKLEFQTIYGMKKKHITLIDAKYVELIAEYDNGLYKKPAKRFRKQFIAFLENLKGTEPDYTNPGVSDNYFN